MLRRRFAVGAAVLVLSASFCFAESIGPGRYSGIVVFDRWGGCILYRGVGVLYVSEAIKGELKDEAGKCIEVEATEVAQVHNPGDALIKQLKILGPAPPALPWQSPAGIKLAVAPAFAKGQKPEFAIRVENAGPKPIPLHMDLLGPTVLGKKVDAGVDDEVAKIKRFFEVADGPSKAVITDQSLWTHSPGEPRLKIKGGDWKWTITQPPTYEERTTLAPKGAFEVRMALDLPAGEYDFLAGYGGNFSTGQCVASNLIGFDVKADGTASLVKVAGR